MNTSQLSCYRCSSTNCKLWYKLTGDSSLNPRPVSKFELYCLLCLKETPVNKLYKSPDEIAILSRVSIPELFNGHIPIAPNWIGNFTPAIADSSELIRWCWVSNAQFKQWEDLPDFPEWWKTYSVVNFERAIGVRQKFESVLRDHESFIAASAKRIVDEIKIYVWSREDKIYSIPEIVHSIYWIENLNNNISKKTLHLILDKIEVKYKNL